MEADPQVAVGDHDPLLVIEGAGDHLTLARLDDRSAAAPEDLLLGELGGEVLGEG